MSVGRREVMFCVNIRVEPDPAGGGGVMRCGGTKEHWALQDTGEQKQGSEVEMRINRSKTHEFGLTESCVCL